MLWNSLQTLRDSSVSFLSQSWQGAQKSAQVKGNFPNTLMGHDKIGADADPNCVINEYGLKAGDKVLPREPKSQFKSTWAQPHPNRVINEYGLRAGDKVLPREPKSQFKSTWAQPHPNRVINEYGLRAGDKVLPQETEHQFKPTWFKA